MTDIIERIEACDSDEVGPNIRRRVLQDARAEILALRAKVDTLGSALEGVAKIAIRESSRVGYAFGHV